MNISILDTKTLGNDISLERFDNLGKVNTYEVTSYNQTIQRLQNIDIAVTNKVVIDKHVIDNTNLKLIVVTATGVNNIDIEYAKEKGIEVKNAVGYSTNSVVQHTFAMAFYIIEKLNFYDNFVKSGKWAQSGLFTSIDRPFFEISGKTWGVIGLGNIGKKVASIASSFGANIIYYSTSGKNSNSEYKRVELYEIMQQSDIISIHAPLNNNTKDLINKDSLKLLKNGAIILNLGRGGIINESDLAQSIDNQDIYVGLDVLENEPIKQYNPLNTIVNKQRLFITPHIAWTSKEAREKLLEITYDNIDSFIS
jgi:glycerate dehydrogenase